MPIDAQIHPTGTAPAPLDYTVPNAQEILLKAVNADFDGSGAAGDFLPCVTILSDGGVVIARAIGSSVTAGDSAEVSFFPGAVKAATAPSPGGTMTLATGFNSVTAGDPNIVVNAGANKNAPFAHVTTSNPAVMSWSTFISGNDQLDFHVDGLFVAFGAAQFDVGGANMAAFPFKTGAGGLLPNDSWDNLDPNNFVDPSGLSTNQGYTIYNNVGGSVSSTHLFLQNTGGVAANAFIVGLAVIYLGVPA